MTRRADPRALVHVFADVALVGEVRGAGVDPDTHVDRPRPQNLASIYSGLGRRGGKANA
jgi:hypothetical protein